MDQIKTIYLGVSVIFSLFFCLSPKISLYLQTTIKLAIENIENVLFVFLYCR